MKERVFLSFKIGVDLKKNFSISYQNYMVKKVNVSHRIKICYKKVLVETVFSMPAPLTFSILSFLVLCSGMSQNFFLKLPFVYPIIS